jgi:hypothetical protein
MTLVARLAALLAVLAFGQAALAQAQPAAPGAALAGRWNLVLQAPQGSFQTPVEFVAGDGNRVTAAILGPSGSFRISDASGVVEGNRLRLSVRSSYGTLRVTATVEGDRLRGQWSPAGLISGLFFRGEVRGVRDGGYRRKPATEVYDQLWSNLERYYYAPDYGGVDVRSLRARYLPQVAASRTDGEFLSIVRNMLAEFRTSHLSLFATPSTEADEQPASSADAAAPTSGITWRQISPAIGYLRIESFDDGPAVVERIDRAFREIGHNGALVIDVRENGGGNISAAMRLGDHIFPEQRPVGYFASREGLVRRRAASIDDLDAGALPRFAGYSSEQLVREMHGSGAVMLVTGGRAPRTYRGKIAILADEYCFSACEAFASVAKESGAATLFGRRTAGAMLAAFPVAIDGGWTLLLPVWDFRTPAGVRVEGRGVEPDVPVRKGRRKDADLAAALRFLQNATRQRR